MSLSRVHVETFARTDTRVGTKFHVYSISAISRSFSLALSPKGRKRKSMPTASHCVRFGHSLRSAISCQRLVINEKNTSLERITRTKESLLLPRQNFSRKNEDTREISLRRINYKFFPILPEITDTETCPGTGHPKTRFAVSSFQWTFSKFTFERSWTPIPRRRNAAKRSERGDRPSGKAKEQGRLCESGEIHPSGFGCCERVFRKSRHCDPVKKR